MGKAEYVLRRSIGDPVEHKFEQRPEKRTPMFASLVRFIQEWKRYSRSVRELSRLDDRELADIGLNRSDIERAAWGAAQLR